VLQCAAVRCSVSQCDAALDFRADCSVLQYVAVSCSVLQCVAVRCNLSQCAAAINFGADCSVLQCVAVR